MRELYEADFHKPRIFAVERVWANASDVVFRAPSRDGRGRRAAVDLVVCFGSGNFFLVFQVTTFFFFKLVHEYTTAGRERPRQQSASTR